MALDYQTRAYGIFGYLSVDPAGWKTMIIVTHDLSEAISLADKVFVLSARPAIDQTVLPIQLTLQDSSYSASLPETPQNFHIISNNFGRN